MEPTALQTVKELTEKLQRVRKSSVPKRGFKFGSASNRAGTSLTAAKLPIPDNEGNTVAPPYNTVAPSSRDSTRETSTSSAEISKDGLGTSLDAIGPSNDLSSNMPNLQSLFGVHWVAGELYYHASSISLIDVNNSLIDLSPAKQLMTLVIKDVTRSLMICGAVAGAAHVTNMQSSTLVMGSRQVRLHECSDCVLYLRCDSKPIIENCERMRFAPTPRTFVSMTNFDCAK